MADWTRDGEPAWQNPHERTYYREAVPPGFHPRNPNSNVAYPNSFTGLSSEQQERQRRLQDSLDKVLGPDYVQTRPGGGGTKLTYLEGWRAINLANEVFGYNGWYTDIKYLEVDFCDYNPESQRWSMGVTAIVRVRLPDGASHEDIGYGKLENTKSKGDGLDKCKKEAVTDGLKRALRHFGKLLGNCLYDKHYLSQLSGMKGKKPKFDWSSLYNAEQHALHATDPQPIPRRADPPLAAMSVPLPDVTASSAATANSAGPVPRPMTRPPPHPAHMQRAQTVGAGTPSRPAAGTTQKPSVQPSATVNGPQRSATVSHSTTTTVKSDAVVRPPLQQQRRRAERAASVATNGTAEYGMGSEDDSFFAAALEATEEVEGEGAGGGGGPSSATLEEHQSIAHGSVRGGDDSGFVEASFLRQESAKDSVPNRNQRPPPYSNDHPRPRTVSNNPDQASAAPANGPGSGLSVAEQNRLAAVARREAKQKAKAAQQHQQQQQQQQHATSTGTSVAGAVQSSRVQPVESRCRSFLFPELPPTDRGHRAQLRPPVAPPSRTTSVSHAATRAPQQQHQAPTPVPEPRQAGTLPTLHVGNGIVQAQHATSTTTGGGGSGDGSPPTFSQGFMSARGVKRRADEGGQVAGAAPVRSHTVSTSNPASANRQPLGELDVTDSGQVKRYRASS
ncbi:hypothetical protein JCM11491_004405 [Sporobolomyces phaffii]